MAHAGAGAISSLSGSDQPQVLVLLDYDGTLIRFTRGSPVKPPEIRLNEKIIESIRAFRETHPDIKVTACIFTARQYLAAQFTHIQDYLMRALCVHPGAKTHEEIFAECLTINKVRAEIFNATGLEIMVASAYDCEKVGEYYNNVLYPGECLESFSLLDYFKEAIEKDVEFRNDLYNCLLKYKFPTRYQKYDVEKSFSIVVILILNDYLTKSYGNSEVEEAEKREIERIARILSGILTYFMDSGKIYKSDLDFQNAEKLCKEREIKERAYHKTLMFMQVLQHFYGINSAEHSELMRLAIFLHEDSDSVIQSLADCEHPIVKAGHSKMAVFKEPDCPFTCYQEVYRRRFRELFKMDLKPWVMPSQFIYFSVAVKEVSSLKMAMPVMSALRLSSEGVGSCEIGAKARDSRSESEATVAVGKK